MLIVIMLVLMLGPYMLKSHSHTLCSYLYHFLKLKLTKLTIVLNFPKGTFSKVHYKQAYMDAFLPSQVVDLLTNWHKSLESTMINRKRDESHINCTALTLVFREPHEQMPLKCILVCL